MTLRLLVAARCMIPSPPAVQAFAFLCFQEIWLMQSSFPHPSSHPLHSTFQRTRHSVSRSLRNLNPSFTNFLISNVFFLDPRRQVHSHTDIPPWCHTSLSSPPLFIVSSTSIYVHALQLRLKPSDASLCTSSHSKAENCGLFRQTFQDSRRSCHCIEGI